MPKKKTERRDRRNPSEKMFDEILELGKTIDKKLDKLHGIDPNMATAVARRIHKLIFPDE